MRVLVTVTRDAQLDWDVDIRVKPPANQADPAAAALPDDRWSRRMPHVTDAGGDSLPTRDPDSLVREPRLSDLSTAAADAILDVYQRIASRKPKAGEIVQYGRYLFDVLIGTAIWTDITARAMARHEDIELALSWNVEDRGLARLHWEMMATGEGFLARGYVDGDQIRDVAITRVVPNTAFEGKQARPVPRVLFVIGTTLKDRTMRPGAEMVGIIQQPGSESRVQWRHIEEATPKATQDAIKSFQPDVVHFICHGGVDAKTREGFLKLRPEQGRGGDQFGATQIATWLRAAEWMPSMVVLSACESGAVGGASLGPDQVAPLAAALVKEGVPVVIGMSGRVSDVACRLFTRRFAEALLSRTARETLVTATALGRRSAFAEGNDPELSVDWGFPTVFLSSGVKPDYIPTPEPAAGAVTVDTRLVAYTLRRDPVFCGRQEFFDAFRELMAVGHGALAAWVDDEKKGYGRTRLLEALTIQALIDGHVPCAVLAREPNWKAPTTVLELGLLVDEAMETARESLLLPTRQDRPMLALEQFQHGSRELDSLPADLQRALNRVARVGEPRLVPAGAVALALEQQFALLMEKARAEKPDLVGAESRAVVLLDDVHEYASLLYDLLGKKLGAYGFGNARESVPIVTAFSGPAAQGAMLRPIVKKEVAGVRALELGRFQRDENGREDMLMYARYLLHTPTNRVVGHGDAMAWVMDYEAPADVVQKYEGKYLKWLEAIPADFDEKLFWSIAEDAVADNFLKPAHDAAWIEEAQRKK